MKPIVNYTIAATRERHSADQNVIRRLRFTLAMMAAGAAALSLVGCSDESFMSQAPQYPESGMVMAFGAKINQESQSRADESGFADGDRMGIFVVDYEEGAPGQLLVMGNRANNTRLTFNAESNTWQSNADIYWRDDQTPVDVYGYYPYDNGLGDVDTYSFEVSSTQDVAGTDGDMGHYEASDFLWAKASHAMPGERINLSYSHRMAGVRVILQEGDGFASGEWDKLKKQVSVDNTCRMAHIDLSTGYVTATGDFDRNVTMAETDAGYRAVVVPQSVDNGKSIIGITIDGIASNFVREGGMTYTSGKLHTFTIKVDKTSMSGDYELTLVDESISTWIADNLSHDFEANSYIVVHVEKAGTLKSVITEMGIDKATLKNLKITGQLTDEDFYFMRDEMPVLSAVNLSEVKLVQCASDNINNNPVNPKDNCLPWRAFSAKQTLRRLILPETVEILGPSCLNGLQLTSTLVIPNSVLRIEDSALYGIGDGGAIEMPDNVKFIGNSAFSGCKALINLNLPNSLDSIGEWAFREASNVTGNFALPPNLKFIGTFAFSGCGHDLTGEIVIPDNITEIPDGAFEAMGFSNGTILKFHDGVKRINQYAFSELRFNTEVNIPDGVSYIGTSAFWKCKFAGGVNIPKNIAYLGTAAFGYSNYSGKLSYPEAFEYAVGSGNVPYPGGMGFGGAFVGSEIDSLVLSNNVLQINGGAFEQCRELRYVSIGKNVGSIAYRAFLNCSQLSHIVCLAPEPPSVESSDVFAGVPIDRVILEVPEASIGAYKNSTVWGQFRNITANRELTFSIHDIKCLNGGVEQSGIIQAESDWTVTELPSWVHLSTTSGTGKDEIVVTVDPLTKGRGTRSGRIVFTLTGKSYTFTTDIVQYDYAYGEDELIALKTASGPGRPVEIFIVGDGFGAESIVNGTYMKVMREQIEYLMAIEPYKSYADYFTVRTAIACSPDDGTGDAFNVRRSRLGTNGVNTDVPTLSSYVGKLFPGGLSDVLIIVVSNYQSFSGEAVDAEGGNNIVTISLTDGAYPYDQRGLVQHYAGGQGFGGLGVESITHFEFMLGCECPLCNSLVEFYKHKAIGKFENLTMSAKMSEAPWAPFIFHEKYSSIVDMYEGGYNHARGVWRSETNSVMNTYIPYYNTISRYAIYKEIMRRAGLSASLDDFIANDKIELP